MDKLYRRWSIK